MSEITFKHSGSMGDIIYSLPTIKRMGGGIIYINTNMFKQMKIFCEMGFHEAIKFPKNVNFEFIKSLLSHQNYISDVVLWKDETVDWDLDFYRTNIKNGKPCKNCRHIVQQIGDYFQVSGPIEKWLNTESYNVSPIIFARSLRYRNPSFPWKKLHKRYSKDAIFVGIKSEHEDFVKHIGNISFYPTKNAWDLANIIAGCKLFIGNQSLPYAIAEGLQKTTIQETCEWCKDCLFIRKNATYFTEGRLNLLSGFL